MNALEALSQCPSLTFPNIHKLLKVLATLPVSTATPERVFSKSGTHSYSSSLDHVRKAFAGFNLTSGAQRTRDSHVG